MTRSEKSALLLQDATLRNFFDIICSDADQTAAIWLENDEEHSFTYGQLGERALACASKIMDMSFGEENGWVGIAVDTCPD